MKPKSTANSGSDQERVRNKYSVNPEIVERLIVGNNEMVQFNFTGSKEIMKEQVCDISLSIIDGMGVEYTDEFNVHESYNRIIDRTTGKVCEVENNIIKDIAIKQGMVQLQFELKYTYNKALKFVYYVEV
ncbi:hypothetical protein ACRS6O_11605 [Bacillus cytotoxicus]|uniref:hypothetical protein n=1 Tax=Bacillus cytotoxicus TaxID=580165 RepID=UPI003D7E216C